MPDQDQPKMRTITLSNRPPVRIREDAWPTIAEAEMHNGQNGDRANANRQWDLRLRQHADGRRIIYGSLRSQWMGEENIRAGHLLEPDDALLNFAADVAATIGCQDPDRLIGKLMADMPAETLD